MSEFSGTPVNIQYEYTDDMLGSFTGGTIVSGQTAPHPIMSDYDYTPYIQLNAITLGGFDGLNG